MTFMTTPLNIYLVQVLNAEPQDQNVINILINLPWSIKLLFGFLSDAMPIFGMRRKVIAFTISHNVYTFIYPFIDSRAQYSSLI